MFLQIHFLTSYHATLLNRDDVGLAKRISFGGQQRLRVEPVPETPLAGMDA